MVLVTFSSSDSPWAKLKSTRYYKLAHVLVISISDTSFPLKAQVRGSCFVLNL